MRENSPERKKFMSDLRYDIAAVLIVIAVGVALFKFILWLIR